MKKPANLRKNAMVIDGPSEGNGPLTPHLTLKPVRLRTVADAKRLLARVTTQLQNGEIDVLKAKALIYCSLSFSQIVSTVDFESKIADLERAREKERHEIEGAAS